MSMQRLRVAFNDALRETGGVMTWDAFEAALVREAGGITLHTFVPPRVRESRSAQLEMFAGTVVSIRYIAKRTGIPKSTVHDFMSGQRTRFRTVA